ncbi:RNA polymerase II-associated protein 1 [Ditylenchus destructor]|uniref:RNA polymerase II-associated protein 1 n=1 Tax=Ditylenchus destructor TaxID=166010 RepID=A0AAD4NIT6_9BILA|nr:RNA polymerase II-associated protein 1 [Ditylenchus destructor]
MSKTDENAENLDEELLEELRAQDEFFAKRDPAGLSSDLNYKPAAKCVRVGAKSKGTQAKKASTRSVHFDHDVRDNEKSPAPFCSIQVTQGSIVMPVQERFVGFFEVPERCVPFDFTVNQNEDEENGFPEVWDLSHQYTSDDCTKTQPTTSVEKEPDVSQNAKLSKSLFAAEFERLNGRRRNESIFKKKQRDATAITDTAQISEEATASMDKDSVNRATSTNKALLAEEEAIKNLEIMDPMDMSEDYTRLAMDAVELDLVTKCLRNTMPRQEQTILRLFDALKVSPDDFAETSAQYELRQFARAKIDQIKELYLEEIFMENNRREWRFARDVNPILNGGWSFVPIRRVLDACQNRSPTADDVEIVSLALLWSVLLMSERPTVFFSFSQPSEVFCRLAEIFLTGPIIFEDNVISKATQALISSYLVPKAEQNLLTLRLTKSIAGLDAFMPFYEELLQRFTQYSMGDENFAIFVLMGAYMNSAIDDSLTMSQLLWTPKYEVVRQMTLQKSSAGFILRHIKMRRSEIVKDIEEQCYESYTQLLAMYAAAIRDEIVTVDRNPVPFAIASEELGEFVKRHTKNKNATPSQSEERLKGIDLLVDMVRVAVAGKISI